MKFTAVTFSLPKRGNSEREYEDAAWPATTLSGEFTELRLAVADGATEGSFCRLWAKLLVQAFRRGCFKGRAISESLDPLQRHWLKRVRRPNLPWYIEQTLEVGAFASLTGLTLTSNGLNGGHWTSTSVGDCCLIHFRRDVVGNPSVRIRPHYTFLDSSPMKSAAQFNSRPVLLSSNPSFNDVVASNTVIKSGEWKSGDSFYLMSDALACWFFKHFELDIQRPFAILHKITSRDEFASFTNSQRTETYEGIPWLKNDDMTLIKCTVTANTSCGHRI